MTNILWQSRSSAFLYIYHCFLLLLVAIGLSTINNLLAFLVLIVAVIMVVDAKSMKYELYKEHMYFSRSLFDNEPANIPLKNIIGLHVIDEKPWSVFSLGTVLLISDYSQGEHPCIKCVKNPHKLARLIRRHALKQGANL